MRLHSLTCVLGTTVLLAAGCGPGGPPSLEGFGSVGETEDLPGDGDPGDGDPGDGDGEPGDGDGDPGECIEQNFGSDEFIYLDDFLDNNKPNDHDGECGFNPAADYSIAWEAPVEGNYRVTLYDEFNGWLTVLAGGCDGEVVNCGGFGFPTIIDFYALPGDDFTFVIDSELEDAFGWFTFTLETMPVATECPVAELYNVPDSVGGSTNGAENQWDSGCGGEESPDRAYAFFPPVSGLYRIDTSGSNYDTMLHVFDQYCGGGLIDCNDDTPENTTSELFVDLVAGNIYTIVVDGWGGSSGDYQLNIELIDAAGICDTIDILDSDVPTGASWSSGDDMGNLFAQCSPASLEQRHLWYAPDSGAYQVTLEGGWSSSVAMALDGCGGSSIVCGQGSIMFEAFAGQEVVFISEWEDEGEDLNLTIDALGGTPGCGMELPSQAPLVIEGTTSGSGNQHDGSCSQSPAPELEYWWTAPETGSYFLSLEGSAYDTLMHVRSGGCEGDELFCNDDTFDGQQVYLWSSGTVNLFAGQTISIFVDGYSGSGPFTLSITEN